MTDKEKKPPVWAYADEWNGMSDVERAIRLSFLVGHQAGVEGRVLKTYALPPQAGDIIQYASAYWQYGEILAIEGDRMLVRRYNIPGTVETSDRWHDVANAVKVVSRRGVERQRNT